MKEKIILVEGDNDHSNLIISEFGINDKGDEAIILKDGQEAIDFFSKTDAVDEDRIASTINMIILDLNLPKVRGLEVLKFIKKNSDYNSVPVIIFSANSNDEIVSEVYECGASGFVKKPASLKEFSDNVRLMKQYWLVQKMITRMQKEKCL